MPSMIRPCGTLRSRKMYQAPMPATMKAVVR